MDNSPENRSNIQKSITWDGIMRLTEICRIASMQLNADVSVLVTFPESPSGGSHHPRPISRGGPIYIVTISAPKEVINEVNKRISEVFIAIAKY